MTGLVELRWYLMFTSIWEWIVMKADELKEYHRQKAKEWNAAHPERKKENDYKAHKR